MSILVKLYNTEEKFRGTTFVKISWKYVENYKGEPDRQFKLFSSIVHGLGAPASAQVEQVLGAIEGENLRVWGKEYFNVAIEHVTDAKQVEYAKEHGYKTTRVYIAEGEDAAAQRLLKLGYKSEFDVMSINAM